MRDFVVVADTSVSNADLFGGLSQDWEFDFGSICYTDVMAICSSVICRHDCLVRGMVGANLYLAGKLHMGAFADEILHGSFGFGA